MQNYFTNETFFIFAAVFVVFLFLGLILKKIGTLIVSMLILIVTMILLYYVRNAVTADDYYILVRLFFTDSFQLVRSINIEQIKYYYSIAAISGIGIGALLS